MKSGVYDHNPVTDVVSFFAAPDVSPEKMLAFRRYVKAAQTNKATREEIEEGVKSLGFSFEEMWKWIETSGNLLSAIGIILNLITIYLTIVTAADDDKDHKEQLQAMADHRVRIEQSIKSTEDNTEAVRENTELQRQILETFERQQETAARPTPQPPRAQTNTTSFVQKPSTTNRHARRKAAKMNRCQR